MTCKSVYRLLSPIPRLRVLYHAPFACASSLSLVISLYFALFLSVFLVCDMKQFVREGRQTCHAKLELWCEVTCLLHCITTVSSTVKHKQITKLKELIKDNYLHQNRIFYKTVFLVKCKHQSIVGSQYQ